MLFDLKLSRTDDYTRHELMTIYQMISDNNGKGPFQTTIPYSLLDAAKRAVLYHTNSQLEVIGTDHQTGRVIIRSPGQR